MEWLKCVRCNGTGKIGIVIMGVRQVFKCMRCGGLGKVRKFPRKKLTQGSLPRKPWR